MKWIPRTVVFILVLLSGPACIAWFGPIDLHQDWRTAPRNSTGVAPTPSATPDAVIQAYAARAFNWRGVFAVHTWIATKAAGASNYTVHQVIGWRAQRKLPVVASGHDVPDRSWYGSDPTILIDIRGEPASRLIPEVAAAVTRYPHARDYRLWPGPNSNTFIAWIARSVPDLKLELPTTAIGKDYLANGAIFAPAPSGTGYQASLFGLFGVLAAKSEGFEFNILGLSFGLDPLAPAVKLPGVDRVGFEIFRQWRETGF